MKEKLEVLAKRLIRHLKSLKDVRVLGLHMFIVIALLVTWSSIGVIQANYGLQQQLSRLQQENKIRKLENETLKLRNQYFETDQYLELAARRQFNKAAPGETVVLVSREIARKHGVEELKLEAPESKAPQKPKHQENFEAWMEFLFRRNAQI